MIRSPIQTLRGWLRPSGQPPGIGDILNPREVWESVEGFR